MILYIATMYRWGDEESHSYVLGVFETKELALAAGQSERDWRGGKYEVKVVVRILNDDGEVK